ncbi:hypothetical protein [Anaerosporobacter sp.]|uniref:hypothetical protein n=1 Tax=Anaerosporobacter sp. TaxID=1872529 RepID=UPI00286EDC95|nr:hypothetical protein [Anaerosporobacter sp.]
MFYEIAQKYMNALTNFVPYATTSKTKKWNDFDSTWKSSAIEASRTFKSFSFPSLPATLFLDYTRIGNRSNYEDIYFLKRRALNALVLAECVSNTGEFLGT